MKNSKTGYRLAAALTAGMMIGSGTKAFAQTVGVSTGFQDVTDNITNASAHLPNLISTVAFVGGLGLGVAGIFKLKQHVDQPAQHPMKDGLIRLGAGGGLLALPYVTDAMMGSIAGAGSTGATLQSFGSADAQTAAG